MTTPSDKLLVQAGFTGAMYGLTDPVFAIANYLVQQPETKPAAMLIIGQLMVSQQNYAEATKVFDQVLAEKDWEKFHAEASAFKNLLKQVQEMTASMVA